MPPVSVGAIVPVHGPAPYLGEALASLLDSAPAPDPIVVVDDASPAPVELPGALRGHVELMRLEERGGAAGARNAGAAALGTEWAALCDCDDTWEPGKLAAQLEVLDRADVSFGSAVVVGPDGSATGEEWERVEPGMHEGPAWAARLYEGNPIPTSSVVVRTELVAFDGAFAPAEDLELWLRLAAAGRRFSYSPAAAVRYRRHPLGLTAGTARLADAQLRLREKHAALADQEARDRLRARDLAALADGRIRARDYAGARAALAQARELAAPAARERALAAALRVPGLRGALGRRDPYR